MAEWKKRPNWRTTGRVSTALLVGAFAAFASYDHMRILALAHGQNPHIAALLPISVDGLIVFATWNMDARNRFWPRLSFWLGVLATISANVLAAPPDLLSQVISAWAPVSLLCVIETWSRRNKVERWQWKKSAEVPAADLVVNTDPAEAAEPKPRQRNARGAQTAQKVAKAAAAVARKNGNASITEIAARAGVSEKTARTYVAPPTPAEVPA